MLHEARKSCAWYARGLYGCNALRLRIWEAPDVAAARALVEDYFAQPIERQRRLGLAPGAERGDMDGGFAGTEASHEASHEPRHEAADEAADEAAETLRPTLKADDFLVAASPAMRAVTAAVQRFADGGAPVLICGEHGTGREPVARVLHRRGPRSASRFVAARPTFEDAPTSPSPGASRSRGSCTGGPAEREPVRRGAADVRGRADQPEPGGERSRRRRRRARAAGAERRERRALSTASGGALLVKDVSARTARSMASEPG